jgi:predicted nucleic acid-binding protein
MAFVLDVSVVMSWCFEDEISPYADRVLEKLDTDVALVPAVWPLEVANALCVAERRQRLRAADVVRFTELVRALPITIDSLSLERAFGSVLMLARAHQLSTYDASYVELAMREGVPLASQDVRMSTAATHLGVSLLR